MTTFRFKSLLCVALLCTYASPALASGGFAAVDVTSVRIKPADAANASVNAFQFRFGSAINQEGTLAGEFRAALGFGSETRNGERYEMNRLFGAYLRGQFPNSMPLRPYGLLGISRVETRQGGSTENYNDLSLGIGVDYSLQHNIFVSLEYLRAIDRSKAEVSNIGLGIGARF
jgi:outer membrane immunogenic protein